MPPALGVWSLSHWTAREVLETSHSKQLGRGPQVELGDAKAGLGSVTHAGHVTLDRLLCFSGPRFPKLKEHDFLL